MVGGGGQVGQGEARGIIAKGYRSLFTVIKTFSNCGHISMIYISVNIVKIIELCILKVRIVQYVNIKLFKRKRKKVGDQNRNLDKRFSGTYPEN